MRRRLYRLIRRQWARFWMNRAGLGPGGRLAMRIATLSSRPFKGRCYLANITSKPFVSPSAVLDHEGLRLGRSVFLGDRVVVHRTTDGGPVELGDGVHLYGDSIVETGQGGSLFIGAETHIQPRCQLSAYRGSIRIGERVEIAPNCAFYPYDHGVVRGVPVRVQPLTSRGDIVIGDDVWLGFGVVVLDGVRIGDGAVIGAGAVVTQDIPSNAIAVGVPARVVRSRPETDAVSARVREPDLPDLEVAARPFALTPQSEEPTAVAPAPHAEERR